MLIPVKACIKLALVGARIATTDYRGRLIISSGYFLILWLLYYLWAALYANSSIRAGMDFYTAFIHISLVQTLLAFLPTGTDWHLAQDIRSGNIASHLVHPISLPLRYFSLSAGQSLAQALYIVPSFIIFLWFFDLFPYVKINNLVFLSIGLSFILLFCIDFIAGLAGFMAADLWGITVSKDVSIHFFGGALIPMAFFPEWIRELLIYSPFWYLFNIPVGYLTGSAHGAVPILIQLIWVALLMYSTLLAGRIVLKKIVIFGA